MHGSMRATLIPGHVSRRTASPTGETLRAMLEQLWSVWLPYLIAAVLLMVLGGWSAATRGRRRSARAGELSGARWIAPPPAFLVPGLSLAVLGWFAVSLTDAVSEGDGLATFDRPVWQWMVDHRDPFRTAVAKVVTEIGSTVAMSIIATLCIVWLLIRRRRGDAAMVAVVGIGAAALVFFAKKLVGRTRPPEEFRLVVETNNSFPSGHALASTAILGIVVVLLLRSGAWGPLWVRIVVPVVLVVFWFSIGISRLYLGEHWSTDVLAGWVSGTAWLLLCVTVRRLYRSWNDNRDAGGPAAIKPGVTDTDPDAGRPADPGSTDHREGRP
ncbi:MAG: phosphatase PAP2 family protein [Nakamurella sp.]